MTVKAPGGDPYTVKTSGDLTNDGKYTFDDVIGLVELYSSGSSSYISDINGDGVTNFDDVMDFLQYYISIS